MTSVAPADRVAAANAANTDFHPKAEAEAALEAPERQGAQPPGAAGLGARAAPGPLQPLWLAAFWRRGATSDGLFASVSNPFGVYDNATNATRAAALELRVKLELAQI